jgi:uncharacterized protein YutD
MKKVVLNDIDYELVKEEKNALIEEELRDKCTEYFIDFDYILGDYAYGKLRLKGFYDTNNKNVKEINNINNLDKYIEEQCAYGCKYYLLKKIIKN